MNLTDETREWSDSFWNCVDTDVLCIQKCKTCGHRQYYPRAVCLDCESVDLELTKVTSELARIYSFSVVHRAPDESKSAPYVVAIVELEDGPRLLTNIVGVQNLDDLHCDMKVKLTFFTDNSGRRLFGFSPVASP